MLTTARTINTFLNIQAVTGIFAKLRIHRLRTDSVVGGVIEHIEEDVSASVPPLRDGCPHEGVPCRPCHDVGVVLPHLHHVKHPGQQTALQVDRLDDLILLRASCT